MTGKELVLKYFHSWQEPADFEELASCLADGFRIDAGFFAFADRDSFIAFLRSNPAPWKEVTLLASIFSEDKSAILYEGINTENDKRMRVSEIIRIKDSTITEVYTVIAEIQ